MKKLLLLLMILGLMLSGTPASIQGNAAASLFTDVPDNAWYKKDLEYIAKDSRKIMEGYNGRFFPGDTLTVEQFLKTVTVAAGFVAEPVQAPIKWSFPYIDKAYSMKLIQSGEFSDYERGITRAEMARIIIRALPSITGETEVSYEADAIKTRMGDYSTIHEALRDYVCQAYQLGILTGGTDGKFDPNKTLVRAEAAAVLHRLVDKTARVTLPEPVETSEMWTDAEFEAFMRSAEVKDYVNTYSVIKVENGKIYFRSLADPTTFSLVPEDINDMVYNLFKIMAYHTKKTDGYMMTGYQNKYEDPYVNFSFYVGKSDYKYISHGAIDLYIHLEPTKSLTAEKYFPGKQKGVSNYRWVIGALKKHNDIVDAGWEPGMPIGDFDNTAERYEVLLRDLCKEVYGEKQGIAFSNYALEENDKYYDLLEKYKANFIGFRSDMGFELVYIYPDIFSGHVFWTDKPEVKK